MAKKTAKSNLTPVVSVQRAWPESTTLASNQTSVNVRLIMVNTTTRDRRLYPLTVADFVPVTQTVYGFVKMTQADVQQPVRFSPENLSKPLMVECMR
jgi:hypothetical protein